MSNESGVRVVIYDQVYHIRPGDESSAQQVEQLARYVDTKMRAVAVQTRDVDSLRVAVLTALHIADEFQSLKNRYETLRAAVEEKSSQCSRLLETEIRKAAV